MVLTHAILAMAMDVYARSRDERVAATAETIGTMLKPFAGKETSTKRQVVGLGHNTVTSCHCNGSQIIKSGAGRWTRTGQCIEKQNVTRKTPFGQIRTEDGETNQPGIAYADQAPRAHAKPGRHPDRTLSYLERNPNETEVELAPADLDKVAKAWPSLPPEIRTAIRTIVAPYLTKEGGE